MREKNQANLFYPAMDQSGFLLEEPVLTVLKASAALEAFSTFFNFFLNFENWESQSGIIITLKELYKCSI